MSDPIQIIPALTILADEGEFTVRVGQEEWASALGRQIVSIIGGMGVARKLTILTPNDTRVFKFDLPKMASTGDEERAGKLAHDKPQPVPLRPSQRISQDSAAPPSPELVGEWEEELANQQRDQAEVERMAKVNAQEAIPSEPIEDAPAPTARRRKNSSKIAEALGSGTACGRCSGAGSLDGGGACPVCQGKGSLRKWGTR